jgi:thiamine-phosphate pyrophosphorylase
VTVRPPLDLSLYLVTDTTLCEARGVAATVREAAGAGVTVVQLRDHRVTDDEFVTLGRSVVSALHGANIPLLVNDRVELVEAIGAHGAHVGQSDMDPVDARRLLGRHAYLGLSAQTVAHIESARSMEPGTIDYLGVGPVWPQTTKPDGAEPCGWARLFALVKASPWPCVAIGGIDGERVQAVHEAGAAGVAVVSAICGQPDIRRSTAVLRSAWDGEAR